MTGTYNLFGAHSIQQGASFRREIAWRDAAMVMLDLTGYTARMMVRAKIDDASPVLTLTTENGRIAVSTGAAGYNILLTVTPGDTAALTDWGQGVYDIELVSAGGTVTRLLEGFAILSKEVSR